MSEPFWKHGEMTLLAKHVGRPVQHVSEVFRRRRNLGPVSARRWERVLSILFRKDVPWYTMTDTEFTAHPAFVQKGPDA